LVHKFSGINVYSVLALPILLYVIENWALRKKDKKRLTSLKMKNFRRTAGYTLLDHKRNEAIFDEFILESVDEKRRRHKSNCRHVTRVDNNRMSKRMLSYRRSGRRRLGRTLKRLLDEAETGLTRPNS
jgi:hypothetical protein